MAKRSTKSSILIISSTYPEHEGDFRPRFVHDLATRLGEHFRIYVLAPSTPATPRVSRMNGVIVVRHRYFLKSMETLSQGNGILENLKRSSFNYLKIPLFVISQLLSTRYLIERTHPQVLNPHWIYPQGLTSLFARAAMRLKPPILLSVHGGDLFSSKHLNFLKRQVINRVDATLFVSRAMLKYAQTQLSIRNNNLNVRSMGVDLTRVFTSENNQKRPINSFIFVGRFAEKKGVPVLLDACKILKKRNIDFTLTFVGEGTSLAASKSQASDYGIADNIQFKGAIAHSLLPDILREHKFFVFPSIVSNNGDQEGTPLAPIEAMGCGCILICSKMECMADITDNYSYAHGFKMGDAEALADTMEYALQSDGVDTKEARQYVLENYDWSAVTNDYLLHINRLLLSSSNTVSPPGTSS